MSEPILPPIIVDPEELYANGMATITNNVPDFDPDVRSSPEAWLMEAVASIAAEIQAATSTVPLEIFRYYGENMVGIAPEEGQQAIAKVTVEAIDSLGYTIPEDTAFLLYTDGETSYEFVAVADTIIPSGSDTVDVDVRCSSALLESNGAGSASVELVDAIPFINNVSISVVAHGGSDDESDDDYIDRLTEMLKLLSLRPITPSDFERYVQAYFGGRWLCLDGYDKDADTWNNPLTVTMVGVKDDGTSFNAGERADVVAFLEENRMANFVVYVMEPSFADISVSFSIEIEEMFDVVDVLSDATESVEDYLLAQNWGLPTSGSTSAWIPTMEVNGYAVASVIINTMGVKALRSITLSGDDGSPLSVVDGNVVLPDKWMLTRPDVILGADFNA